MPNKQEIYLDKVKASLDTRCPKRGSSMAPNQLRRTPTKLNAPSAAISQNFSLLGYFTAPLFSKTVRKYRAKYVSSNLRAEELPPAIQSLHCALIFR